MSLVADNLVEVKKRIALAVAHSNRLPDEVKLVAVTKTQSAARVIEGIEAGIEVIGENRVQEALAKHAEIGDRVQWHLIGHLQKNKVKKALSVFSMIHSVDSLDLAQEISRQAGILNKSVDILLQVNVSGELSKFGLSPGQVFEVANQVTDLSNITLCGLMTIPPFSNNPEDNRFYFRELAGLKEELTKQGIKGLQYLSMGMSQDYEVAIEEGANFIRIGSAIFGERDTFTNT